VTTLAGGVLSKDISDGHVVTTKVVKRYLSRCPTTLLTSFYLDNRHNAKSAISKPAASKRNIHLAFFIDLLTSKVENVTRLVLGLPFVNVPKESIVQLATNCHSLRALFLSGEYVGNLGMYQ